MTAENDIRRALAELAPRPRADDEALAGMRRAVARRRRRQTLGRIAVVCALAGVGAAGAALVRAGGDDPPSYQMPAGPGPSGPSTTPTTAPMGDPSRTVRFANVTFELPEGWAVIGDGRQPLCVAPVANPAPRFALCAGLALYHGDLPGYRGRPYEKDGPWPFFHTRDPVPCPGGPPDAAAGGDTVVPGTAGTAPIDEGFRDVGDRKAAYDQWFARCTRSSFTFTPRAWYLPKSQIVIFDVFGRPETDRILASFRFDDPGTGRAP